MICIPNYTKKALQQKPEEIRVSRIATFVVGGLAILLGLVFEGQNLAYLVSLAFTVSASTNFPALILALYWRGLTEKGMIIGGALGLVSAVLALVLGPAVWVDILGHDTALFPFRYPVLFSMILAFSG